MTEVAVPLLFTPITWRSVTARNRIMVAPMCQYRSIDGAPVDWHLVNLGRFAIGGAGIVFCEETAVEARGRKTHDCAGLYDDAQMRGNRRINEFLSSMGAVPAVQLGHAGRSASTRGALEGWKPLTEADAAAGRPPWPVIGPSALPESPASQVPHAMDHDDIRAHLAVWRESALLAAEAGFEILEIHGAHGYLIHEFLSPLSNTRNDAYGGDLEGRMRFALEITETVRAAWPAGLPLFFRLSSVDGRGGLWGLDETVALSRALAARGVDVIDCSSGGIRGDTAMAELPRVPGYHVAYSSRVRREVGIPTVAVGLITEAAHAEALLVEGHADVIALAREFMHDPNWPMHAAQALGVPGALELLPLSDSARLRQREGHRRTYPTGCDVMIPVGVGEALAYDWGKGRPVLEG